MPAKMHTSLALDLFVRYTLPGQWVLDPFGGVGTTMIGALMQECRHVVCVELEEPFARLAARCSERWGQFQLDGFEKGRRLVVCGDSRRLPFPDALAQSAVTSPPYAEAITSGGETAAWRAKYGYQGSNGGYSGIAAAVSSPPYADEIDRDRTSEPNEAARAARFHGYGYGDRTRHLGPYGRTNGQIGGLKLDSPQKRGLAAAIGSPPYTDQRPECNGAAGSRGGSLKQRAKQDYLDYSRSEGQIGNLALGLDGGITSPPYVDARGDWSKPEGAGNIRYGGTPGQVGGLVQEDYGAAVRAVYAECRRVIVPGGVLVLVTGDSIKDRQRVDLAAVNIRAAESAGWLFNERWRHVKSAVSFWQHTAGKQGRPVVAEEDVLVFTNGPQAWPWRALPPTRAAPAVIRPKPEAPIPVPMLPLEEATW